MSFSNCQFGSIYYAQLHHPHYYLFNVDLLLIRAANNNGLFDYV